MAAVTRRQYKGASTSTTITGAINSVATSATLAATAGWPSTAAVPFFVVIDPGTSAEEKCSATISGSTLTLTRGQDDTTAIAHAAGAKIYPVFTAFEANEANDLAAKLTTKGDLLVTTGSALNRLAVGTDNYVLTADSAATNGVKWGVGTTFAYKVGDTGPGGGIVFFVDYHDVHAGFDFLEVAPIGAQVSRTWAPSSPTNYQATSVSGADSRALGAGYQNTIDIVAQGHSDAATSAAKYCDSLSFGGQTDWYLPSLGELQLIGRVVYSDLSVGDFDNEYLWSSTEFQSNATWGYNFYLQRGDLSSKGNSFSFRPVRRFS